MNFTAVFFCCYYQKNSIMKRLFKPLILFAALFSCLVASAQQTTILPLTSSDLFKAADNYQKGLYDKAFEDFKALSITGDANAIYGLGVCYYNGKGVTKDLSEAFKCFDKSYRWGNKSAAHSSWANAICTDRVRARTLSRQRNILPKPPIKATSKLRHCYPR